MRASLVMAGDPWLLSGELHGPVGVLQHTNAFSSASISLFHKITLYTITAKNIMLQDITNTDNSC